MGNAARSVLNVAVEDEVLIVEYLAAVAAKESRCIKVKIKAAVILVCIPAETNDDL